VADKVKDPNDQVLALLEYQRRVLEQIASHAPLDEILLMLVRFVELQVPAMRCSILQVDHSGKRLEFIAAPNIPEDFKACMEPLLGIGPDMANCGRAAFWREPIYTEDMTVDPLWARCRDVAQRHGVRAVWSTPILSDDKTALGTFAMYYGEPGLPTHEHVQLIEMAVQMARVAIQSKDAEERRRASEAALRENETALRESAERLQHLSRRLLALQEEERRRLSRELHDQFGDTLTALSINLSMLKDAVRHDPQASARIADSAALVQSTAAAIENIVAELRPPLLDDHGLAAALSMYGKQFAARVGVEVSVEEADDAGNVTPEVRIALFRIAQEALNNVAKHARAEGVIISLRRSPAEFVMTISDDGVGLRAAEASEQRGTGMGMVTMRERAQALGGRFEAESLPERGTRLTVRILR
jgi:signal transduction histidine kinase